MKTLKFIVDSRGLRKDPLCDFRKVSRGVKEPIQAEFAFSPEWDSTNIRVAGFWSNGVECPPQLLANNMTCMIPTEALTKSVFELQVFGKKNTATMKTNKLRVILNGGAL